MLVGDIISNNACLFPDKTGIVDAQSQVRLTWKEVNSRVNSLANAMLDLGVKKGDRACIISENSLQCAEFQFAVAKAGVIGVGLNYRLTGKQLSYIINDAGSKVVFVQSKFVDTINSIRSDLKTVEHFVGIDAGHSYPIDYEQLVIHSPDHEPTIDIGEDEPLMIVYSSGTTGLPKGVVVTHRNRIAYCVHACMFGERYTHEDVMLNLLPFCAGTGGQVHFFGPAFAGATVVMYVLKGDTWAEVVERERVTINWLTTTRLKPVWDFLKESDRKYDLSSLRCVPLGGQAMTGEQIKEMLDFCSVSQSCRVYASTESGGVGTKLLPHEIAAGLSPNATEREKRRLDSVGRALLDMKLRVVDENDEDVKVGQVGEILIRGDAVAKGYWNNPELTREIFRGGWLHMRDMGMLDEDGFLYFVGRKDYIIKTGGFLVSPSEVEDAILRHPAVAEVAVIGVPDERWGEAVKAVVRLKKGQNTTEGEIIAHCRNYLGGFQVPKSVDFMDDLPKDETGRMRLADLKKIYWGKERQELLGREQA